MLKNHATNKNYKVYPQLQLKLNENNRTLAMVMAIPTKEMQMMRNHLSRVRMVDLATTLNVKKTDRCYNALVKSN